MPSEPDEILQSVGEAIATGQQGDRALARTILEEAWNRIGAETGDPLHRCAIAHSMADVQDDLEDELLWDLRALSAADLLTDGHVHAAGMAGTASQLLPSLHLNVADVYRRLGQPAVALEHVQRARAALDTLPDDGYRAMISDALTRVESGSFQLPDSVRRR